MAAAPGDDDGAPERKISVAVREALPYWNPVAEGGISSILPSGPANLQSSRSAARQFMQDVYYAGTHFRAMVREALVALHGELSPEIAASDTRPVDDIINQWAAQLLVPQTEFVNNVMHYASSSAVPPGGGNDEGGEEEEFVTVGGGGDDNDGERETSDNEDGEVNAFSPSRPHSPSAGGGDDDNEEPLQSDGDSKRGGGGDDYVQPLEPEVDVQPREPKMKREEGKETIPSDDDNEDEDDGNDPLPPFLPPGADVTIDGDDLMARTTLLSRDERSSGLLMPRSPMKFDGNDPRTIARIELALGDFGIGARTTDGEFDVRTMHCIVRLLQWPGMPSCLDEGEIATAVLGDDNKTPFQPGIPTLDQLEIVYSGYVLDVSNLLGNYAANSQSGIDARENNTRALNLVYLASSWLLQGLDAVYRDGVSVDAFILKAENVAKALRSWCLLQPPFLGDCETHLAFIAVLAFYWRVRTRVRDEQSFTMFWMAFYEAVQIHYADVTVNASSTLRLIAPDHSVAYKRHRAIANMAMFTVTAAMTSVVPFGTAAHAIGGMLKIILGYEDGQKDRIHTFPSSDIEITSLGFELKGNHLQRRGLIGDVKLVALVNGEVSDQEPNAFNSARRRNMNGSFMRLGVGGLYVDRSQPNDYLVSSRAVSAIRLQFGGNEESGAIPAVVQVIEDGDPRHYQTMIRIPNRGILQCNGYRYEDKGDAHAQLSVFGYVIAFCGEYFPLAPLPPPPSPPTLPLSSLSSSSSSPSIQRPLKRPLVNTPTVVGLKLVRSAAAAPAAHFVPPLPSNNKRARFDPGGVSAVSAHHSGWRPASPTRSAAVVSSSSSRSPTRGLFDAAINVPDVIHHPPPPSMATPLPPSVVHALSSPSAPPTPSPPREIAPVMVPSADDPSWPFGAPTPEMVARDLELHNQLARDEYLSGLNSLVPKYYDRERPPGTSAMMKNDLNRFQASVQWTRAFEDIKAYIAGHNIAELANDSSLKAFVKYHIQTAVKDYITEKTARDRVHTERAFGAFPELRGWLLSHYKHALNHDTDDPPDINLSTITELISAVFEEEAPKWLADEAPPGRTTTKPTKSEMTYIQTRISKRLRARYMTNPRDTNKTAPIARSGDDGGGGGGMDLRDDGVESKETKTRGRRRLPAQPALLPAVPSSSSSTVEPPTPKWQPYQHPYSWEQHYLKWSGKGAAKIAESYGDDIAYGWLPVDYHTFQAIERFGQPDPYSNEWTIPHRGGGFIREDIPGNLPWASDNTTHRTFLTEEQQNESRVWIVLVTWTPDITQGSIDEYRRQPIRRLLVMLLQGYTIGLKVLPDRAEDSKEPWPVDAFAYSHPFVWTDEENEQRPAYPGTLSWPPDPEDGKYNRLPWPHWPVSLYPAQVLRLADDNEVGADIFGPAHPGSDKQKERDDIVERHMKMCLAMKSIFANTDPTRDRFMAIDEEHYHTITRRHRSLVTADLAVDRMLRVVPRSSPAYASRLAGLLSRLHETGYLPLVPNAKYIPRGGRFATSMASTMAREESATVDQIKATLPSDFFVDWPQLKAWCEETILYGTRSVRLPSDLKTPRRFDTTQLEYMKNLAHVIQKDLDVDPDRRGAKAWIPWPDYNGSRPPANSRVQEQAGLMKQLAYQAMFLRSIYELGTARDIPAELTEQCTTLQLLVCGPAIKSLLRLSIVYDERERKASRSGHTSMTMLDNHYSNLPYIMDIISLDLDTQFILKKTNWDYDIHRPSFHNAPVPKFDVSPPPPPAPPPKALKPKPKDQAAPKDKAKPRSSKGNEKKSAPRRAAAASSSSKGKKRGSTKGKPKAKAKEKAKAKAKAKAKSAAKPRSRKGKVPSVPKLVGDGRAAAATPAPTDLEAIANIASAQPKRFVDYQTMLRLGIETAAPPPPPPIGPSPKSRKEKKTQAAAPPPPPKPKKKDKKSKSRSRSPSPGEQLAIWEAEEREADAKAYEETLAFERALRDQITATSASLLASNASSSSWGARNLGH